MIRIIYLLLISLVAHIASGQYTFINYSSRNGLASNSINAIIRDKYGFMWFGTEDGLNRFDGQTFKVYRHKEGDSTSLQRGPIMALTQDDKGNIWIATNLALSVCNPNLDGFRNYDFSNYGWILSICADQKGKIWVGTYSGLFLFDPATSKVTSFPVSSGKQPEIVHCIFEDSKKNIWVGSDRGLSRLNRLSGAFIKYISYDELKGNPARSIRSIAEDKTGNLWAGTNYKGLAVLDPETGKVRHYYSEPSNAATLSSNRIHKVVFDQSGILWVGTETGIDVFDPVSGKATRLNNTPANPYGAPTKGRSVREIFIDNDGIYWIAIHQGGVNKYDTNLAYFSHKQYNNFDPNGLTASSVMAFAQSPAGEIFIGTEGGGLNVMNLTTGQIRPFRLHHPQANASSVLALQTLDNTLWMGTFQAGLYSVNLSSGTDRYHPVPAGKNDDADVPVNCIKVDRSGKLWLGTNGSGVRLYDPKSHEQSYQQDVFQQPNPLNGYITAIEQDKQGNLWMGSNGTGLAIYNPSTGRFLHLDHANSNLPMDVVQTIYCDHAGRVWIGVLGGGLCLYHPQKRNFEVFDEKFFLSNDVIHKILEDESGKLWLSTNQGISSFDPARKIFRNFTRYNGVQQSTFNIGSGLKTSGGEMFFGGLDGFNYFYPSEISQKKNVPPLVVTSLKVNNKLVSPAANGEITEPIADAGKITLSYKQNFSLEYIALNYTTPHETVYSYILEGFDKEWNRAGDVKSAVYTNLDPGSYVFRLKAQSEDNSWQTAEKVIQVVVKPPFWRTYYAYFFYFIFISGILWIIRQRSIQKLKNEFARQQERLELNHLIEKERHEAEQKTELEKVKVKFLTNMSHELKTPLTLVLNPIENLMFQEQSPEKLEMLNLISRNAKRLLNLVNQLLDFKKVETNELTLNPTEGDLVTFSQEIVNSFKYIAVRKNINLHFVSAFSNYITRFDKDKVERILINLLSNAIKFTNNCGSVSFQLTAGDSDGINLIIGDTGIGLAENMRERVFERFFQINNNADILNQGSGIGLSIAQEFVHLHGGTIQVESQESEGSTFTVYLPLQPLSSEESREKQEPGMITGFALQKPPGIDLPTVLIADDDEDLRSYLVESLKTKYKVIEASDGKQGWQKTLAHHPKVIVTDVNMPSMDGIEMTQKIKGDKRTRHIPVIILTVLSDETNQLRGLEAGASDFLTKPFSFNLLSIKIENLLSLSNELKSTYSKKIQLESQLPEIVNEDERFLLSVNKYIDEYMEDTDLSIEALSKSMYVSRGTLYNKLLALTGETPVEYVRSRKLIRAAILLEKSDMKISQIAYSVGFSNPNYFARAFKAKYNVSPTEYIARFKKDKS